MRQVDRTMRWAIAVALLAAATACDDRGGAATPSDATLRHVSQAEAVALLESDAPPLLLDVRTQSEYDAGHVPGAVLVPHTQLAERLDDVLSNRDRLIVVYCESGKRAGMAVEVLQRAGVEHLARLDGDMAGWRKAGLPQER